MNGDLLQSTKTVIRSLIISCPESGMTIRQLNEDFKKYQGTYIPHNQLGYPRLDTFLRSLTDVVKVINSGAEIFVYAIVPENLTHINNMVARQKKPINKPQFWRRQNQQNFCSGHKSYKQPPQINTNNKMGPVHNFTQSQNQTTQLTNQRSTLPTKNELKPFRIIPSNIPTMQVDLTKFNNFNLDYLRTIGSTQSHSKEFISPIHSSQLNPIRNMNPFATSNNLGQINSELNCNLFQQNFNLFDNPNSFTQNNSQRYVTPNNLLQNNNSYTNYLGQTMYNNLIQQNWNTSTKPIVDSQKYQNNFITENSWAIPISKSFCPLKEFSIPNSSDSRQYNCNLFQPNNNSFRNPNSSIHIDSQQQFNNNCIQQNINALCAISSSSDDLYSVRKNDSFFLSSNNSIELNSGKSKSNFIETQEKKHEQFKKNEKINKDIGCPLINFDSDSGSTKSVDALPFLAEDDPILQRNKKYASTIKPSTFNSNVQINELLEVFVTEVHSPSRFWFHAASESAKLDRLMTDIEDYYETLNPNELILGERNIKPGQICCGLYSYMWHRGEIVGEIHENKVQVHFVDYGTTTRIPLNDLKCLVPKFAELPRQAIRGSLYGITSKEHRWRRATTFSMLEMVTDLKLNCFVVEIDEKDKTISMILSDTNKEIAIIINNELVQKNLAREISSNNVQPSCVRKKLFAELYPTFESLEQAQYPSFESACRLFDKGVDIDMLDYDNLIEVSDICYKHTNPFL